LASCTATRRCAADASSAAVVARASRPCVSIRTGETPVHYPLPKGRGKLALRPGLFHAKDRFECGLFRLGQRHAQFSELEFPRRGGGGLSNFHHILGGFGRGGLRRLQLIGLSLSPASWTAPADPTRELPTALRRSSRDLFGRRQVRARLLDRQRRCRQRFLHDEFAFVRALSFARKRDRLDHQVAAQENRRDRGRESMVCPWLRFVTAHEQVSGRVEERIIRPRESGLGSVRFTGQAVNTDMLRSKKRGVDNTPFAAIGSNLWSWQRAH